MNTVELLQYNLGFAFEILGQVTADLTQEQADWVPPGTANSIGSVYSHIVTYLDFHLREIAVPQNDQPFKSPPPEEIIMHPIQVDIKILHERAELVHINALSWLATLSPDDLEKKLNTSLGELKLGHYVESYFVWQINTHCGEIAALKGCQGEKGYPW